MRIYPVLIILLLATVTGVALAGDGRTEINQASVEAAGGFPMTISEPGSYVLTGNLLVPANTDGFVLTTSGVVFDLNGFSLAGPATCTVAGCTLGTGMAIRGFSGIAHARDTTVKNGFIHGFGNNCVRLGSAAHVKDLRVSECGRHGISVAGGSLVKDNRVSQTGEHGIFMSGTPPAFAHNLVSDAGLQGGVFSLFSDVSGGRAVAGNICSDGSCTAVPARRYYITPDFYEGDQALSACAAGFHMAAVRELTEASNLRYASELGYNLSDSGSGPPLGPPGWVRTGYSVANVGGAGYANCNNWSSASGGDRGTFLYLGPELDDTTSTNYTKWKYTTGFCARDFTRTWCIED